MENKCGDSKIPMPAAAAAPDPGTI